MKLTKHFTLEELCASSTAKRLNISNKPTNEEIDNMKHLALSILEPLRLFMQKPIYINSGFRSQKLNKAVGGVASSQHTRGEAADIRVTTIAEGKVMFEYIRRNTPFDQLIWERNARGSRWIHVSARRDGRNRHQVIC